jgi:hypothetical protein
MNKKAITPMISTVLLIFFATGLGTLVMSWGASAKVPKAEAVKDICDDISIKITELAFERQVCFGDGILKAVIENNGKADLDNIRAVFLMQEGSMEHVTAAMRAGDIRISEFLIGDGKILKARFIPLAQGTTCIEKRIEVENIRECEDEP